MCGLKKAARGKCAHIESIHPPVMKQQFIVFLAGSREQVGQS
jgi:hypothetical protein